MTTRAAVLACVRMGMSWETVALAFKLTDAEFAAILKRRRGKRQR